MSNDSIHVIDCRGHVGRGDEYGMSDEPARLAAVGIDQAAACAHPNVYLKTCSSFRTLGVIEELVGPAGADRVLFGSDMPLMDSRCQLGKIITADSSNAAKRPVLGANARRLLFRNAE